ncbi:hypothetical protein BN863_13500 [Formosa agariphila KMM 3901]|uniref:Uncharacterized protein n=1 Tax=Formosa agariphila (strain DSM 15362 / KCTC 12365 / LMG 23005 / KMM 3901 / M-2Alg 35-1) TaxID=1347342 RepID=T2KJJ6_FORAG|nr:hypothetical protein BN863_13500 [Formosa agariphila KMM 3901]
MERTTKALYDKLKRMKNKIHGDALHIAVYNAFEKYSIKND